MSPNKPHDDWFLTLPLKAMERLSFISWDYMSIAPTDYIKLAYTWWNKKTISEKSEIINQEQERFKNNKKPKSFL